MPPLPQLAWPLARLGQALTALARQQGLPLSPQETPPPPASLEQQGMEALTAWLDATATWLGLEVEPIEVPYAEVASALQRAGPALVRLTGAQEAHFLVLLGQRRRLVVLLGPDLRRHRVRAETLRAAVCQAREAPVLADVEALLATVGVRAWRRQRARRVLLGERLRDTRWSDCWLVRLPAGASFWRQLRQARVPRHLLVLLGAHLGQWCLWLLAWGVLGQGALQGRLDRGWLVAWGLLLLTLVPLRLLVTWSQGQLAIHTGARLKLRLLAGTLQLAPEVVRQQGAGQLLGTVLESAALEALALSGGLLGLMASLELVLAIVVLSHGSGGGLQTLILVGWLLVASGLGWRYMRQRHAWTAARLALTHDLVERMVGHRTRLVQESPTGWHDGEDHALARYLTLAQRLDRHFTLLTALVPRGWLLLGWLSLAPAILQGASSPATMAVSLGGMLLAYEALRKLVTGCGHLAGAVLAWQQVTPLWRAASVPAPTVPPMPLPASRPGHTPPPVLEAQDLVFRYRAAGPPVLHDCTLRVYAGDRLLLEGTSGGGKSTLAALLTGLRQPESGLLLLGGLDRQTLGSAGWRRRVVAAPQFHDNHVFIGSFLFNLLMGRRWPPHPDDVAEAEALCRELGLGDLLDRMPAGLLQMVGEIGWQLSHGEQSRLFIARALLQHAEVIILDESFAALDPETLQQVQRCVLAHAATLLVIAHP